MPLRHLLLRLLVVLLLMNRFCLAQTNTPYQEIMLATDTFFDFGPPFSYYNVYKLTSLGERTTVERVSVTPPAGTCALPEVKSASATLDDGLSTLFGGRDLCRIPSKDLKREEKRCKHCLTFSGIHMTAQVSCAGVTRNIRFEVLDRDIFDQRTQTPMNTSRSMALLGKLDKALGGGPMNEPAFRINNSREPAAPVNPDAMLLDLESGRYDALISGDSLSALYKDSQQPSIDRTVTVEAVEGPAPIHPTRPVYPPIARAAHVEGEVLLSIRMNPDGAVTEASTISGPKLLQGVSEAAAKEWTFPSTADGGTSKIRFVFALNCPTLHTSSSSLR